MAHLAYIDRDGAPPETRAHLEANTGTYGRPSLFARAMTPNPGVLDARQRYARGGGGRERPRSGARRARDRRRLRDQRLCVLRGEPRSATRRGARAPGRPCPGGALGEYGGLDDRERTAVEFAEQVDREPTVDGIDDLRAVDLNEREIVALMTASATAVSADVIADALGIDPADGSSPFVGNIDED